MCCCGCGLMLAEWAGQNTDAAAAGTKPTQDACTLTPVNAAPGVTRDQGGGWFARLLRLGLRPAGKHKVAAV